LRLHQWPFDYPSLLKPPFPQYFNATKKMSKWFFLRFRKRASWKKKRELISWETKFDQFGWASLCPFVV
jgi:hypothetical protein